MASMFGRKDYNSIPRLDLWGNFLEPCRPLGFDDKFREKMRCTPATFDALVERLKQTDVYRRRMQRTGRGLDVLLQRRPWSASTCSLARSRTRGLRLPATSVGKATSARLYRAASIEGRTGSLPTLRLAGQTLHLGCVRARERRGSFSHGRRPRHAPRGLQSQTKRLNKSPTRPPALRRRDRWHARETRQCKFCVCVLPPAPADRDREA